MVIHFTCNNHNLLKRLTMKLTKSINKKLLNEIIGAFIAILGVTSIANAATITVDNKTNAVAMYTSLQDAVDAASAGDVILVAGSPTLYGDVTIDKQLSVIGAGYQYVSVQQGYYSRVGNITLTTGTSTSASSSYFSGLDRPTFILGNNITSITIERCYVANVGMDSGSSLDMRNSIVTGQINAGGANYNNSNPSRQVDINIYNSIIGRIDSKNELSNILIDHCLFYRAFTYFGIINAIINNSIFYGGDTQLYLDRAIGCNFNHCLSYGTTGTIISGTNSGGNNINNTDPLFSNFSSTYIHQIFDKLDDYRLQTGSPAIGAASDGTDIGIYGGSYPFPVGGEGEFLMAAPPQIPQIYEMNIQNATVPVNGTLSVQVKAKKID